MSTGKSPLPVCCTSVGRAGMEAVRIIPLEPGDWNLKPSLRLGRWLYEVELDHLPDQLVDIFLVAFLSDADGYDNNNDRCVLGLVNYTVPLAGRAYAAIAAQFSEQWLALLFGIVSQPVDPLRDLPRNTAVLHSFERFKGHGCDLDPVPQPSISFLATSQETVFPSLASLMPWRRDVINCSSPMISSVS